MLKVLVCLLLWQASSSVSAKRRLNFPDRYITSGVLHLPYAELYEPFEAWVDLPRDASRLDYYGGVTKTFQMGGKGGGSMYKMMPVTRDTSKILNKQMCFKSSGSPTTPVHALSVLPNTTDFVYIGSGSMDGTTCDKFVMKTSNGGKMNYYTMWATTEGATTYRPVIYEMKGYDSLLGSHYDHYIVQYNVFIDAEPAMTDLQPPNPKSCSGWSPGAGDNTYHMSPFFEFFEHHPERRDQHVEQAFRHHHQQHGWKYRSLHHKRNATHHFRHNMRYIHSKNRANLTFRLASNHLADRSIDQFKALRGYRYNHGERGSLKFPYGIEEVRRDNIPENFDWRLFGAVTSVKDQAVCGSCWSFGTTGAVESDYFVHTKQLVRLSQQALVDCSWGQGNNGCDGGEDTNSYKWILKHGLPTEFEYGQYLGIDGYCHVDSANAHAVNISGHTDVPSGDMDAARHSLVKHGPLSVAIDASHLSFAFYSNGVYYEEKCGNKPDQLDHAVLAVGYGEMYGEPYWLVKNSWSTYWGNDGYVLMSRKNNNCGVATAATYVNFE